MSYTETKNSTELLKKQISSAAGTSRVHINRLIGLVSMLEEQGSGEVTYELMISCYKLLTQNMNMMYLYSEDLVVGKPTVINAETLLTSIIRECTPMIENIGGEFRFEVKCGRSSVRVDEKAFIITVMNLLQNAGLYSPPKTPISVMLENKIVDSRNYVSISVKNLVGADEIESRCVADECSGLGLHLCMKVAESYNGELRYVEEDGSVTVKFMLPLDSEDPKIGLSSDFVDYISDRNKPVKLFMYEVLASKSK
jgi:signal transduction histidine kinase